MPQEGDQLKQVTLTVNLSYAKSCLGILKVVQFVLLLITWACMADCCVVPSWYSFAGSFGFFLFVTIFLWLCTPVIYLCFLFVLDEKLKALDPRFVVLGFDIFWASLLLISAALVTEVAAGADYLGRFGATSKVFNAMAAGVSFGFFSLVAFIVDIVILIINLLKSRQVVTTTSAAAPL